MISVARPTPNEIANRLTGRSYLSYSAINTYRSCPLKYRFKYLDGLPETTISASLVFGSAIHRAAEFHFNELLAGNDAPSAEALLGEFDAAWNEYDPPSISFGKQEGREELLPLAQRVLAAFQSSELANPRGVILGVEEEVRGQIVPDCPDLLGRIDLVVERDASVVVTDLKTSRSRWSRDQAEDAGEQLLLYSELVKGIIPGKRLRLQFVVVTKAQEPSVELYEVAVNHKRIDRTKRIVERVWRAIESEAFFPTPSVMNCNGCPFRAPCREWNG